MDTLVHAGPTRFDFVLGAMGASIFCGGAVGLLSSVPLYVAGCVSSLLAAGVVVGATAGEC
jgi:hypothetical protein